MTWILGVELNPDQKNNKILSAVVSLCPILLYIFTSPCLVISLSSHVSCPLVCPFFQSGAIYLISKRHPVITGTYYSYAAEIEQIYGFVIAGMITNVHSPEYVQKPYQHLGLLIIASLKILPKVIMSEISLGHVLQPIKLSLFECKIYFMRVHATFLTLLSSRKKIFSHSSCSTMSMNTLHCHTE